MRIEIEIPKEFEEYFKQDKFKDSFERIMAYIEHSLENGDCLCAGRYEFETIEMLEKALENSKPAYDVGKVVEKFDKKYNNSLWIKGNEEFSITRNELIEIVKQGGVSDDVCEWKFEETNGIAWHCDDKCTTYNQVYIKDLKITLEDFECKCPYCGKKIKVVE